jgi:hypothetical protein
MRLDGYKRVERGQEKCICGFPSGAGGANQINERIRARRRRRQSNQWAHSRPAPRDLKSEGGYSRLSRAA